MVGQRIMKTNFGLFDQVLDCVVQKKAKMVQ